ncbi:hypothetical protein QR680_017671 [Steinernema hermaphroditum]|uniref:Phytanoyl-CoA hydroxylase-interacting protein-like C-terminal domain-containing protein n=1 Tax=Steinernema hermaphroditum TaxID=289476 RepID=A0AA39LPG3_9BILA|nr:hypothetical protein QR680_017671 [Steinernema hermaphroditum]
MDDSADSYEDDLILEFRESSLQCIVCWSHTGEPPLKVEYGVEVRNSENIKVASKRGPLQGRHLRVTTEPGETYFVKVICFEENSKCRLLSAEGKFRAVFSLDEMQMLYRRAVVSLGHPHSYQRVEVLYRCKPANYFHEAVEEFSNTMVPYVKDENGHKACPINGSINGLFFSARLNRFRKVPKISPFGDTQFIISANVLLDPDNLLYYFADFYCNSKSHYVTIVVCRPGSDANRFCAQHLPLLPKTQNPFMKIARMPDGECEYYVDQEIWVEIYYTEVVPLSLGRMRNVTAKGLGTSQLGGLEHNRKCTQCNIYPKYE